MPSMNTNERTRENWLPMAWTNWRVKRAGDGLGAAVGHQPAADLGLDLPAQPLDALLELVALEPLVERRHPPRLLSRRVDEALQDGVELEVPQRAVEVVGATHGSPR